MSCLYCSAGKDLHEQKNLLGTTFFFFWLKQQHADKVLKMGSTGNDIAISQNGLLLDIF